MIFKKILYKEDLLAGFVVFLVALPLCLGIALASNAPLMAGLSSGIIGGILVGFLSGSHTSISGPAAGLTALIAMQIHQLGSFEAFLAALIVAGAVQMILGLVRAGFIAAFFPSSVIKGLLFAIGLLLILKQIPHLFGVDSDYEGEMTFFQADHENTFSELVNIFTQFHYGAMLIGILSLSLLFLWEKTPRIKQWLPAPLAVVSLATLISITASQFFSAWALAPEHLVQVPELNSLKNLASLFTWPDFQAFFNPAIYSAAISLGIVASLETLINLEAVDKIDPQQRVSPPNRELIAQGFSNMVLGFIGGLPLTSVIVRSSVNINARAQSKNSTIFHGVLLLFSLMLIPQVLNQIPLAVLAAILIGAGLKLSDPRIIKHMWHSGVSQFIPFIITVSAIIFSDLLIGVVLGLGSSIIFILANNLATPLRSLTERRIDGEAVRIFLPEHVSFLNRPSLKRKLLDFPEQGRLIIDASRSSFIDDDIIEMLSDFKENTAIRKEISLSLIGFKACNNLPNQILYSQHATSQLQQALKPSQIIQSLKDGNDRMLAGNCLPKNLGNQIMATSDGQFPLAAVLSCIDSRTPAELIFDLGIGDIFSIRMAGNVVSEKVLGSLEFACAVSGAKVIVVMGHSKCGAVSAAIDLFKSGKSTTEAFGCHHLNAITDDIQAALHGEIPSYVPDKTSDSRSAYEQRVIIDNVYQSMKAISSRSEVLSKLLAEAKIELIGCIYDVVTGQVSFMPQLLCSTTISEYRETYEPKFAHSDNDVNST